VTPEADTRLVNLARVLADGELVVVPLPGEVAVPVAPGPSTGAAGGGAPGGGGAAGAPAGPLDLNAADAAVAGHAPRHRPRPGAADRPAPERGGSVRLRRRPRRGQRHRPRPHDGPPRPGHRCDGRRPGRAASTPRGHDLRLAPAAVGCWLAAWAGTGATAASVGHVTVLVLVLTSTVVALLAASSLLARRWPGPSPAAVLALLSGARRARSPGRAVPGRSVRHGAVQRGPPGRLHRGRAGRHGRGAGAAGDARSRAVAERGGAAAVELVVTGDPASGLGTAAWQREQVRLPVELVRLGVPEGRGTEVRVPALLSADASWADARWGERRRTVVLLREAPPGEAYAVFASVAGPTTVLAEPAGGGGARSGCAPAWSGPRRPVPGRRSATAPRCCPASSSGTPGCSRRTSSTTCAWRGSATCPRSPGPT
jgi:hypothetical protein